MRQNPRPRIAKVTADQIVLAITPVFADDPLAAHRLALLAKQLPEVRARAREQQRVMRLLVY